MTTPAKIAAELARHRTITTAYSKAGLCLRCSGLAARGHMYGWADLSDPCARCAATVAALPHPTPAEAWRALRPTSGGGHNDAA